MRSFKKNLGYFAIAVVIICLIFPEKSYPFFSSFTGVVTILTVILFWPLSFFKKLKQAMSYYFLFASFVFGTFALLLAQVLTHEAPFSPYAIVWAFFSNMTAKIAINLIGYSLFSIFCATYSSYLEKNHIKK